MDTRQHQTGAPPAQHQGLPAAWLHGHGSAMQLQFQTEASCCPIERVKKAHQHQVVGNARHNDRPRSKKLRRIAQLVLHDDAVDRAAERERRR